MASKKQQHKKTIKWVDFGIRGTPEENKKVNAAALLARQSRCQFVLQASLERAEAYLQPKQEK
jgi:uncharacterized protein (DUF1778 family)